MVRQAATLPHIIFSQYGFLKLFLLNINKCVEIESFYSIPEISIFIFFLIFHFQLFKKVNQISKHFCTHFAAFFTILSCDTSSKCIRKFLRNLELFCNILHCFHSLSITEMVSFIMKSRKVSHTFPLKMENSVSWNQKLFFQSEIICIKMYNVFQIDFYMI